MLSLAVFLPIVCGLLLLLLGRSVGHRMRQVLVETVTVVTSLLVLFCLLNRRGTVYTPFYLLPSLPHPLCDRWGGKRVHGDCRLSLAAGRAVWI